MITLTPEAKNNTVVPILLTAPLYLRRKTSFPPTNVFRRTFASEFALDNDASLSVTFRNYSKVFAVFHCIARHLCMPKTEDVPMKDAVFPESSLFLHSPRLSPTISGSWRRQPRRRVLSAFRFREV